MRIAIATLLIVLGLMIAPAVMAQGTNPGGPASGQQGGQSPVWSDRLLRISLPSRFH